MMGNLNFGGKKIDKRKQLQKILKDTKCKVRRYSCLGGLSKNCFSIR